MPHARWSGLGRTELIAFGKITITERLERLGCSVTSSSDRRDGRLRVRTPTGRALEVFVSTQRVGGYAFWTKRRLQPAEDRFAALVLLGDESDPMIYLIPSLDWLQAQKPLTDRDYEGKESEAEWGIEIHASSVPLLGRYAWTGASASRHLG